MSTRSFNRARSQKRGFTIIEMMVGMLIALITVLVVTQVMVLSGTRGRVAGTSSDAQANGGLALFRIERDAKNAGFGMTSNQALLGCEIRSKYGANAPVTQTLAPVTIGTEADGTQTLTFLASDKSSATLPTLVTNWDSSSTLFQVQSNLTFEVGDFFLAAPADPDTNNWCTLLQVTPNASSTALNTITYGYGTGSCISTSCAGSLWNQPGSLFPSNGYPAGSSLVNLGTFSQHVYRINNKNLELSTDGGASYSVIYPQVVQLQAQYMDPADSSQWTDTAPASALLWQTMKAIRVAIVTRSPEYNKDIVTNSSTDSACKDVTTRDPRAVCWSNGVIDVSTTGSDSSGDWQHYRYFVFEAVLPLRNLIWYQ